MFGLDFLFSAALWALPLAGLPILLHMLFRRKSPVVFFSTLRFVKASIQHTAARRRIQKWLLLACRVLLLALLIWAVAQPVRMLATGWFDTGQSTIVAIVIDTSYSMQLKQQELTLLQGANDTVLELLREPLKDARVAVFRSRPGGEGHPESLEPAAKVISQWAGLEPEPSPLPLSRRVADAAAFLSRQQAGQKWLVVLSDFQGREFPAAMAQPKDVRAVVFDLHPEKFASNGITSVKIEPERPIPGVGATAVIEVSGQAGDVPFATLNLTKPDGTVLRTFANLQGNVEATGKARIRVPLEDGLPVEPWLVAKAQLQREDDLAWDNARSLLVELPPRQKVTFVDDAVGQPAAAMFIRLALDPWEGKVESWPIELSRGKALSGREQVVVMPLTAWPDDRQAQQLSQFVLGGGSLVLLLQPGLEQSWAKLPPRQKQRMLALLPAEPAPTLPGGGSAGASGRYRAAPPARPDRVLEGLADPSFRLDQLSIRRFVPFAVPSDPAVSTLLHLSPADGYGRVTSFGLLYRRMVGSGTVYTFASLPDGRYMNPPTHPVMLPLLVGMALRPAERRDSQNIEVGEALMLSGSKYDAVPELDVEGPGGERYRVRVAEQGGRKFVFEKTDRPGIYRWRRPGDAVPVAMATVELPAEESDLAYRAADSVATAGPGCLIVRSLEEMRSNVGKLNEPEPRWTVPVVVVLGLICLEALLGSVSQWWKGRGQG